MSLSRGGLQGIARRGSSSPWLCQLFHFLYKDKVSTVQSKATLFKIQTHACNGQSLHAEAASTTRHSMFPPHQQGLSSQNYAPLPLSSQEGSRVSGGASPCTPHRVCCHLRQTRNPYTEYLPTTQQLTQKPAGSQHVF